MTLVVWTIQNSNGKESDNWLAFDTLDEAKKVYDYLLELDDTYSAHICSIIKSTDYDLKEAS